MTPEERLALLRGGAKKQSANVRALARFAANSACPTATLGFAARVDFDELLVGTRYAPPYGQSPFAFRRGNTFEKRLRDHEHMPLRSLLEEHLHVPAADASVKNLRDGLPPSKARAAETEALIKAIIKKEKGAPNLIDGAVLMKEVGGIPSLFEADAVAASFHGEILAGEVKSFPTVDGQADPEKLGAAVAQVSIYILLLREMVDRLGGNAELVSAQALIITPRNTGLQPTLTAKHVGRQIDRAQRVLSSVPRAKDMVADIPTSVEGFGPVTPGGGRTEQQRVDAALHILDAVGSEFKPSCLSSCGFAKLCRAQASSCGDLARLGGALERALPGVESIDRVGQLATGSKPSPDEAVAAERLLETQALLDGWARPAPRGGRKP